MLTSTRCILEIGPLYALINSLQMTLDLLYVDSGTDHNGIALLQGEIETFYSRGKPMYTGKGSILTCSDVF